MKLSVIVPSYNEAKTLPEILRKVLNANPRLDLEVLVVDDGSQDATPQVVERLGDPRVRLLRHPSNRGKGAAVRTGLAAATGDFVIIQDADLEYDPADYERLLAPLREGRSEVVYGSRILKSGNRSSYRRYYWGGQLVSWWANLLFGSRLTDEPTCYKLMPTDLLRSLNLESEGFEFCPEVTAKVLKRGLKILEVPISYHPRTLEEGKKITWRDGVVAFWTLLKYRFRG